MIDVDLYRLADSPKDWPKTLRREPGVYELIVVQENEIPQPLDRVAGQDLGALLYIGQVGVLRSRLADIRRTLCEGRPGPGPMPAMTYQASPCWRTIAPPAQIRFRFTHCGDCRDEEVRRLKRYFQIFGEVPPLNGRAEFIRRRSPVLEDTQVMSDLSD